jgi:acyl-CoA synthetase (AMP-forming)/AMP-acid ligase II
VAENSHFSLRPGCSAAFAIEEQGKTQLVIVAEVHPRYIPTVAALPDADPKTEDFPAIRQPVDAEEIYKSIRRAVAEAHDLQITHIQLIKAGRIFKTSSGKIQRRACKTAFLENKLDKWNE